jgi:hypothetical protein
MVTRSKKHTSAPKSPLRTQSTLNRYAAGRSSSGSPAHKKANDRPTPMSCAGRSGGLARTDGSLNSYAILQDIEDGISTSSEEQPMDDTLDGMEHTLISGDTSETTGSLPICPDQATTDTVQDKNTLGDDTMSVASVDTEMTSNRGNPGLSASADNPARQLLNQVLIHNLQNQDQAAETLTSDTMEDTPTPPDGSNNLETQRATQEIPLEQMIQPATMFSTPIHRNGTVQNPYASRSRSGSSHSGNNSRHLPPAAPVITTVASQPTHITGSRTRHLNKDIKL